MRILLASSLAAAALAGCGSTPRATTPTPTPPPSGRERATCPTDDALTAVARKHFGAAPGDDLGATCTAVYTDRALWVIDGYHQGSENGVALVTALVDPATDTAVWVTGAGDFDFPPGAVDRMSGPGLSPADLDGDGKDELISITGTAAQGYDVQTLAVFTIGPAGLIPAGEIPFLEDNSASDVDPADLVSCSTAWKLIAGPDGTKRLDLTVTAQGSGELSCLPAGHHVMAWDGKALVEVAP